MNLKLKDVKNICHSAIKDGLYIQFRNRHGGVQVYNPRLATITRFNNVDNNKPSKFISYKFIGFQEYITKKHGFY